MINLSVNNPLTNPIFTEVVKRFIWLFVAGFILILLLNKLRIKGLWKTNVGQRYLSWLIIGITFLAAIFFSGWVSKVYLLLFMILGIWEVGQITKLPKAYTFTLYVLSLVTILVAEMYSDKFYTLPLLYFMVLGFVAIRLNNGKGLNHLAISLYSSIWIIFALAHFILLGQLNAGIDSSAALLLMIGFAVPLSDIGAYVIGKAFSKTWFNKFKIADKISPNKTYAGVLGNILGAGIGVWIMCFALKSYFSSTSLIILPILIGIFGVVGDLSESLLKRSFGKKDSSNIIPGHGGILDRIDSVLRVIVVVFYFSLLTL